MNMRVCIKNSMQYWIVGDSSSRLPAFIKQLDTNFKHASNHVSNMMHEAGASAFAPAQIRAGLDCLCASYPPIPCRRYRSGYVATYARSHDASGHAITGKNAWAGI